MLAWDWEAFIELDVPTDFSLEITLISELYTNVGNHYYSKELRVIVAKIIYENVCGVRLLIDDAN